MVWKLLSVIAALAMGGSAYFAYISQNDIKNELAARKQAESKLAKLKEGQAEAKKKEEAKKAQVATLQEDLKKTKDEYARSAGELEDKSKAVTDATADRDKKAGELAQMEKKIEEAGDIQKLIASVKALDAEKASADSTLATQTQAVSQAEAALAELQKQIETSREAEARARKGELQPDFTARVAQAFPDWGFAVLSKGNAAGVVANADLHVKRGDEIVAKLKVRNVEQAISVADIIPGSLAAGDTLRAGDLVVAAPVVKKEPEKKEQAPAPPVGQAAAPVTNADPFGAAPAPGGAPAAPMAADPFGTPAATPPAGAPAAPAPADPFGTPTAEKPPAAGAGTKASPSTADPFK